MKKLHGIQILLAVAVLLCLPGKLNAGQIYRWVDENGVVSYSNVAPPENEADFGVIEETVQEDEEAVAVQSEAGGQSAETAVPEEAVGDEPQGDMAAGTRAPGRKKAKPGEPASEERKLTEEEMAKLEEAAKNEAIKAKPLREKYLSQRIEDTKRSIDEIEKQLQYHPDDESLIRSLIIKKKHLRNYMRASQTGNY